MYYVDGNIVSVERIRRQLRPFIEGAYINVPDQYIEDFGPCIMDQL
jgi:hypothetical protein